MRVTQKHVVYTGLIVVVVLSAFILYIGYASWSPINRESAERIKRGMTLSDVEHILGKPADFESLPPAREPGVVLPSERTTRSWRGPRGECIVMFDAAGRVEVAVFYDVPDTGPIGRFLGFFGLER
jgi:hypothetical protein